MPGFADYFEKDFVSGTEFVQLFGVGAEMDFTISGFEMRESYDDEAKKNVPKPVMHLLELPKGRPIFLNGTNHDVLTELFGRGYDDNPAVLGQRITLTSERKLADRKKNEYMNIIWVVRKKHPDQNQPVGEKIAARWMARLKEVGGSVAGFLKFVQPQNPHAHEKLYGCTQPAEYPVRALGLMGQYVEACLKVAPRDAATGRLEPVPPAAGSGAKAAPPPAGGIKLDRSTAQAPAPPEELSEDDIPF